MNEIKDRTFVLIGRMGYPHADVKKEIRRRGGRIKSEVTSETNYLIRGVIHPTDRTAERDSSQIEQAIRLQKEGCEIRIMWPHDLFAMFADADEQNC